MVGLRERSRYCTHCGRQVREMEKVGGLITDPKPFLFTWNFVFKATKRQNFNIVRRTESGLRGQKSSTRLEYRS